MSGDDYIIDGSASLRMGEYSAINIIYLYTLHYSLYLIFIVFNHKFVHDEVVLFNEFRLLKQSKLPTAWNGSN